MYDKSCNYRSDITCRVDPQDYSAITQMMTHWSLALSKWSVGPSVLVLMLVTIVMVINTQGVIRITNCRGQQVTGLQ